MKIYYESLDGSRFSLLKKLKMLGKNFYLAGGTGLALQLGHRISEDFDFFTHKKFDNINLFDRLKELLPEFILSIIQAEENTLTIMINNEVKSSFFKVGYENLLTLVTTEYVQIAQVKEIGVMKLLALTRALYKDYVDLYFILQEYPLEDLISLAKKKHPEFQESIYLKCLLSYHDVEKIPVVYMPGKEISPVEVFKFIEMTTVKFLDKKDRGK
ncbi:MAG TPA: nucleotidyl transferase AbiEii/AbiGii toxin family protein [Ignavibacteriaceae bacterium]|nr:nucleotidyl transferase AbiEii/AbiGii toxin family protein [Ignavibacteriaceae bacterium]